MFVVKYVRVLFNTADCTYEAYFLTFHLNPSTKCDQLQSKLIVKVTIVDCYSHIFV